MAPAPDSTMLFKSLGILPSKFLTVLSYHPSSFPLSWYLSYLCDSHMLRVARSQIESNFGPPPANTDPEGLSLWLCSLAPVSAAAKLKWLQGKSTIERLEEVAASFVQPRPSYRRWMQVALILIIVLGMTAMIPQMTSSPDKKNLEWLWIQVTEMQCPLWIQTFLDWIWVPSPFL
jgi:hypothetical protein